MPAEPQPRSLPDQPSLRYLKIEAKRRLAAGEFTSLHDAQLAIAREHGLPSWAALKERVDAQPAEESHAVTQLKWLVSRFEGADGPDWVAPDETELGQHFGERFLAVATTAKVVQTLSRRAGQLRDELVVVHDDQGRVRAQIGGMQFEAAAEPEPPYRLAGLVVYPVGGTVTDQRVATPSGELAGAVPDGVVPVADTALRELGLVGLVLAGGAADGGAAGPSDPPWVVSRGWADLDKGELLRPGHRFPAMSVTKLITATTVLRLVADGLADLDGPANEHLRRVRLADDSVTIRELLSHSGGVDARLRTFADVVPELAELAGGVLSCDGQRGEFGYSNAGYAALGELIADITGTSYAQAATSLVLQPLGMTSSEFPQTWPGSGPAAVTGYELSDGTFTPAPECVCTMPAAGGLWTTGADLVRFALSWSSLLPEALGREALTRHVARNGAVHVGLGWNVNPDRGVAGHSGSGPGGSSSLVVTFRRHGEVVSPGTDLADRRAHVALTNRRMQVEPVNGRVIRATTET
jgi:CubicO group peptidase (beta-lactamase class C family)